MIQYNHGFIRSCPSLNVRICSKGSSNFLCSSAGFLIILAFSFSGCSGRSSHSHPAAENGMLDLSSVDWRENHKVKLEGSWEFYHNQFYTSEDFLNQSARDKPRYVSMPGYWNDTGKNHPPISGQGFGTYRLKIKISRNDVTRHLALYIPHAYTAYALYADGNFTSGNGVPGKSEDRHIAFFLPEAAAVIPARDEIEIIIHVSNYLSQRGGFRQSIELGPENEILHYKQKLLAWDVFLLGSILMIGLYHLGLFLLRRQEIYALYFSLFSFFVSNYKMTTGEFFISLLFPSLSWLQMLSVFFLSLYLVPVSYLFFLDALYPKESGKKYITGFSLAFLIPVIAILMIDYHLAEYTLYIVEIFVPASGMYSFFILTKASLRKREAAAGFLAGFAIFLLSIVNDVLFERDVIHTEILVPSGVFVLLFSHSFFLLKRFTHLFQTVEVQKIDLQKSVMLKDSLYAMELQSKRLEMEMLKKTIQPHFLINSLSAIRSWLREDPDKSMQILDDFAGEMRIIQKIANQKLIPLKDELDLCRYHLKVMAMRMEKTYPFYTRGISGNENIPPMIFHTLIENAFSHFDSAHGKMIFMLVKKENLNGGRIHTAYTFSVKNTDTAPKKSGHSGSGMGLRYIQTRLEESYPGAWSADSAAVKNRYRTTIQIEENENANSDC